MANVLITGANGFVGRRLLRRLLDDGHVPIALVRDYNRKTDKDLLDEVHKK